MPTPSFALTYDSLITTVEQYLERNDAAVVDRIPTFISLCEFGIAQQIKTLGQIEVAQGTFLAGNPVVQKPARWRKTVSMSVGAGKSPMFLRKYEYLTNYAAQSTPGTPLYYGDYDADNWFITPIPDVDYQFETLVYQRVQPLSSANQTNWFTNNAPNVMIYGTLTQAMSYLKSDARIATFKGQYDEAMAALKAEDVTRTGDRSAVALDS